MMRVLVTGATGFLGKRLAYRLNEMGHSVTAIGRNKSVGAELKCNGINFESCDLRDKDSIINVCKNSDFVFHCGALSSPWGRYRDFYDVNVTGTINVIEGCRKNDFTRLIHVSTPSVYFNMQDKLDINENDILPEKPVNDYAKTKLLAEKEIDKAYKDGLQTIIIRPRAIFGAGDTSIIPRLIKANGKFGVPIIDGGNALIDVTHVENVVEAMILCMNANEKCLGKKYNITNGFPVHFIDLLKLLFEKLNYEFRPREISFENAYTIANAMEFISKTILFGREPILTRYTVGVLAKSQTLSIKSAKEDLGYIPKVNIEEGIGEFAKWWNAKCI